MSATTNYTNPIDLYRQGVAILAEHLGPVDSIRFLRLLDKGTGDYTAARQSQPTKEPCRNSVPKSVHLRQRRASLERMLRSRQDAED